MADGNWVTINGVHVLIGGDGTVIKGPENMLNKHIRHLSEEDDNDLGVTLWSTMDSWSRNSSDIRRASRGETPNDSIYSVAITSPTKSRKLEQFIKDKPIISKPMYRGIHDLSDEDFKKVTTVGNTIDQLGLSSWSLNESTASFFRGYNKNSLMFVMLGGSKQARKIGDIYDLVSTEGEVILSAKSRQKVVGVKTDNRGYYTVFLEEI